MNESLQSLKQWHKLLEDGIISQEEFDAKKNEILGISTNYQNNFEETKNVSFNLKENDVFTIRGKGKFVLKGILGTTGKGRMRISVIHYK